MKIKEIILALSSFGLLMISFGCTHFHKVTISKKSSDSTKNEYHTNIVFQEVSIGEVVDVFEMKCVKDNFKIRALTKETCSKFKVGEARILKFSSPDIATIEPTTNFNLNSSMYIEKKLNAK